MHEKGLTLVDLKPESMLICRRPGGDLLVKIVDFGVSKEMKHCVCWVMATHKHFYGYMAPEVP